MNDMELTILLVGLMLLIIGLGSWISLRIKENDDDSSISNSTEINKEFNEQAVKMTIQFSIINNSEWELLHADFNKTQQFLISSGWIEKDNSIFLSTDVEDDNLYKYIQLSYDSNNFPVLRAGFISSDQKLDDSPKPLDSLMIHYDDEIAFNNIVQSISNSLEKIITSDGTALEFVLYELDGLIQSSKDGENFVRNSGFEPSDYIGFSTESEEADVLFDIFLIERMKVAEPASELMIKLAIAVLDNIMRKYSLGKYQFNQPPNSHGNIKNEFVEIEKNISPYKEMHRSIPIFLNSKEINKFYHFTDIKNLDSIIENGGLYSWNGLKKENIQSCLSSNELSRQLDIRYNLQDYVRLSFADYHPMSTKVEKQDGKNLIWLEIDLDVALWESTLFSDINATDSNVTVDGSFDFLKTFDFTIFRQRYSGLDNLRKKKYQAEILVKDFLSIEYIRNINELKEKYLDAEEILF